MSEKKENDITQWLTADQIRELFPGMSEYTVRTACRRGVFGDHARKVGRDWVVYKPAAIEYFNRGKKPGRPRWERANGQESE